MSVLVPNLGELLADLVEGSPGAEVAAMFNAEDLATAKSSLRGLLMSWEEPQVDAGIAEPTDAA